MNTNRLLPTLISTALAATLVVGMSGCSLAIKEPEAAPSPAASAAPEQNVTESEPDDTEPGVDIDSLDLPELSGYTGDGDVEDCAGRDIVVDTLGALVELEGSCASVTINTDGALVILESAGTVSVSGVGNQVQVLDTVDTVTVGGDAGMVAVYEAGTLEITGVSNVVTAQYVTTVNATGTGNVVQWSDGPSAGTDTGAGNTFLRP